MPTFAAAFFLLFSMAKLWVVADATGRFPAVSVCRPSETAIFSCRLTGGRGSVVHCGGNKGVPDEDCPMKIEGPDKSRQTGPSKKKGSVSSGDGSFGSMVTGGAKESGGASATHSVARVDALLSVQAAEDPTARAARRRMRERGDNILDELEKIRIGLLTGTLTVGHVIGVADVVASHREKIMDPRLTAILDEIDLRAQVELAKMRQAMNRPS